MVVLLWTTLSQTIQERKDAPMPENYLEQYYYSGNDLGITYQKSHSSFRLWAPTAESVSLVLYRLAMIVMGKFIQ